VVGRVVAAVPRVVAGQQRAVAVVGLAGMHGGSSWVGSPASHCWLC
jgi:hypothetical protein